MEREGEGGNEWTHAKLEPLTAKVDIVGGVELLALLFERVNSRETRVLLNPAEKTSRGCWFVQRSAGRQGCHITKDAALMPMSPTGGDRWK